MQIRKHKKIGPKQLRRWFYYSRWYCCTHPDCKTTCVHSQDYMVVTPGSLTKWPRCSGGSDGSVRQTHAVVSGKLNCAVLKKGSVRSGEHSCDAWQPSANNCGRANSMLPGFTPSGRCRHIGDWNGPNTGFTITGAVAFIDTLKLFLWRPLPAGVLKLLGQQYRGRMQFHELPVPGRPRAFRAILTLHQPEVATLAQLSALQRGRFAVHAVHIPVDFLCADRRQAVLATEFLTINLTQKWRRRDHRIQLQMTTRYWKKGRKELRNIALYGDRLSKPVPLPCAHLELRFTSAAACKRAMLNDLNALASGVDAMGLLRRQTAITFVDPKRLERAAEILARRTVRRRPGQHTVADVRGRAQDLLERCLAPVDDSSVAKARAREQLWELRPKLRRRLITALPWEQFTPRPRWHAWRGSNTTDNATDNTTHNYHLAHNTLMLRAKNQPKNTRPRSIKQLPARHNQKLQVGIPRKQPRSGSRAGSGLKFNKAYAHRNQNWARFHEPAD